MPVVHQGEKMASEISDDDLTCHVFSFFDAAVHVAINNSSRNLIIEKEASNFIAL